MSKRPKQDPVEQEIETEVNGQTFRGWYFVRSGVVTVSHPIYGRKSTQVGGSTPGRIARILLGELVVKSLQKP